jgi:hypothetical protein
MEEELKQLKTFRKTLKTVKGKLIGVHQGAFEEFLEHSFKEAEDELEVRIEDLETMKVEDD